jgi:hypothetical protein
LNGVEGLKRLKRLKRLKGKRIPLLREGGESPVSMTVVVKNDTLRDIETRAATTRLDSSFCSKRNLDSSAFAKEGNPFLFTLSPFHPFTLPPRPPFPPFSPLHPVNTLQPSSRFNTSLNNPLFPMNHVAAVNLFDRAALLLHA